MKYRFFRVRRSLGDRARQSEAVRYANSCHRDQFSKVYAKFMQSLCKCYAEFMQGLCKVYARTKYSKSEIYQRKATYPIFSWLAWRRRQRPQSAADVVPAKCLREYKCPVPGVSLYEVQSGELSKVVWENTSA
jgi:hypothetical protein